MGDTLTSMRSARSVAASLASREEREFRFTSSLRCNLDDMRHTPEPILIVVATLIAALLVMGFAACTSLLYGGLNAMIAGKSRCGHLVEDEEENTVIEEIVDTTDPINSYPHDSYIVVTPSHQPLIKNDRTQDELSSSNNFPPNVCLNAGLFTQEPDHAELYDKSSVLRLETELNRPDSHRRTLSDLSHGSTVSQQDLKRSRLNSRPDVSSIKSCESNVDNPGHTPALQSGSTLSDLCYSDDTSQEGLPEPDPATHHSQNHRCSWSIITQSGAKKASKEDHQQKASALPVPLGNYYSHQYHLHEWDDISDLSSADGEPPIECHTPRTRTRSEITCDDNASTPQPVLKRSRHNRSRSPVRPAAPPIDPSPQRQREHSSRASGHTDGESEQSSEVEKASLPAGPTQRTLIRHQSDRLPASSHQNEELPPRRAVSAPAKSAGQCPFERPLDHPFDEPAATARSPAGCTSSPHNSSVNNITIYNTPPHRPRSPPNVKVKGFDDVDDVKVLEADVQLSSALCALPSAPPLSSTDSPPSSTKSAKSKSFWKSMKSWIPGSAPRKGATEVPNIDDTTIVTAENAISNSSNEAASSQYSNWDKLKVQVGFSYQEVFFGGLIEHEKGRR